MVKLRLKRMGNKFNAFYRIVAADARAPRDGRFIEEIGYYNPHSKETFVNTELRTKWEGEGAVASTTVKNLFKKYDKAAKDSKNGIVKLEVKEKKVKKDKVEEMAQSIEETKVEPAENTETAKEKVAPAAEEKTEEK